MELNITLYDCITLLSTIFIFLTNIKQKKKNNIIIIRKCIPEPIRTNRTVRMSDVGPIRLDHNYKTHIEVTPVGIFRYTVYRSPD